MCLKKILLFAFANILSVLSYAQVGINTESPKPSAILDIQSSNKGVLLPRITLTGEEDNVTILGDSPEIGLLIYNTGENPNFPTSGFMFWNGTKWRLLSDVTTRKPEINGELLKNSAVLTPNSYTANVNYDGILEVGYTGGNGSSYSVGETYEYQGLYFTLQPGKAEGVGKLTYRVTGKPRVSYPSVISNVPIKFLGKQIGVYSIGGAISTPTIQYTLNSSFLISEGSTGETGNSINTGYGGSIFYWRRNDISGSTHAIKLPETGHYVFSFRLYGSMAGTAPASSPFYMIAVKQNGVTPTNSDEVRDIAEITISKISTYANTTYSINMTVAGTAGELIYFKIGGALGGALKWTLLSGVAGAGYANRADRTSMFYWKL